MVLFILFNGGGLSKEQWYKNPFTQTKTSFVSKLKKLGNVYAYNPIFYNFNQFTNKFSSSGYDKEFTFKLSDLQLKAHCEKLYDDVKNIDSKFFLISHSRGHMIALKFAELYELKITGFINIDGGYSNEWYLEWLKQDKIKELKKITNNDLKNLFGKLENKTDIESTVRSLDQIVKYHMFKQYKLKSLFCFPMIILNNSCLPDHIDDKNIFMYNFNSALALSKFQSFESV